MKLSDLQQAVKDDWHNKSKLKPSTEMQLLFVIEELGEVAEAIRKRSTSVDYKVNDGDLGSEFADLLISTITLANSYDVNLEYEIDRFWEKLATRRKK